MKHPVDTSQWGEFVVGELFDVQLSDGDNKPKKLPKGTIPLVSAGNTNNGIVGSFESNTIIFPAHSITVDMFGQAFYQPKEFQAVSHGRVNVLVPSFENNENIGQFIVTILNAQCQKYSFTEMLTSKKIKGETIPLPLKPSTDPSNYDSTDIDWDYMETVMSRVTTRAKERLASLPQTTDKKKTPVNTSTQGEFDITTLFDIINTKSIRQSDVQEQLQSNDGSIPYITASDKNNAIAAYIECPQEWIDKGNCIFIGGKTTTITYQTQDFCSNDSHNLALYLKNEQARTKYIQLYLASIPKKHLPNIIGAMRYLKPKPKPKPLNSPSNQ